MGGATWWVTSFLRDDDAKRQRFAMRELRRLHDVYGTWEAAAVGEGRAVRTITRAVALARKLDPEFLKVGK